MDEQCSQSPEEMGQAIYSESYLIKRPLLEAILGSRGNTPVLLIDELSSQMATLKRKFHKIIWLNPLLTTRDYQPICQGMSAALKM